jgi:hypothetical protein
MNCTLVQFWHRATAVTKELKETPDANTPSSRRRPAELLYHVEPNHIQDVMHRLPAPRTLMGYKMCKLSWLRA